jgi:hypothetical protein
MSRIRKMFVILGVVCFSFSVAAANQLVGTTVTSYVSPPACTLEDHFQFHEMVQPSRLHALASPLRISPCGAAQ